MSTKDEEDAWRSIVENYGERAQLDDDRPGAQPRGPAGVQGDVQGHVQGHVQGDGAVDAPDHRTGGPAGDTSSPQGPTWPPQPERFVPFEGTVGDPSPSEHREHTRDAEDDEPRFVPATPPLPYVPPRRLAAWCVLVLAPLTLILCGAMEWYVPTVLRVLLVAAPLGAFGYLLATMSREPRDPFDDGARV